MLVAGIVVGEALLLVQHFKSLRCKLGFQNIITVKQKDTVCFYEGKDCLIRADSISKKCVPFGEMWGFWKAAHKVIEENGAI